jgi:lipopolysaccharide export system permease protein
MKKTIFNNLYGEIFVFFVVCSITLTLIVWILQAVNFLDIVSEDGHSIATYFQYSALNIPKIFNKLLLLSFFLSLFYILNLYEDKNQLVIYWINGIDKFQFLKKILFLSLLFVLFSLMLSYFVVPYTQDKARSFIRTSNLDFFPSLIKPKKFIDTVENLTIFLDYKKDNSIERILIKDSSSNNQQVILAKKGKIINNPEEKYLLLEDGKIINYSTKENLVTFNFKETSFNLGKYKTKSTTSPKIQELKSLTIINCLNHLKKNFETQKILNNLNCNKSVFKNLIQEIYKRIYLPLYIPLLSIIASFVVLKSNYNFNFKSFKIKIFLLGILLIIISQISVNTITINSISGFITILLPILLIILGMISFKIKINSSN